jgi:hypothetical protein
MGGVCDRAEGEKADDKGAAGKRGEDEGDAFAAVAAAAAVRVRFKLAELRLLPREGASTRPSKLMLWMELEWLR